MTRTITQNKATILQNANANSAVLNQSEIFKYLHQPKGQLSGNSSNSRYVFAKNQANGAQNLINAKSNENVSPFKTVAVQTVYREQETQTQPCSLDYKLKDPNDPPPEVLALATLTYGAGLPAGLAEVEMIERARAKRAWEASLPEGDDAASFELRVRMMEQMELQEWQEREQEIQRLQDARMELLQQIIADREAQMDEANTERLQKLWQRKLQEKERLVDRLKEKKLKMGRKLANKRSKIDTTLSKRRDIIEDYTNYASDVYLPKKRNGAAPNVNALNVPNLDPYLSELENVEQLEEKVLEQHLRVNLLPPDLSSNTFGSPFDRRQKALQEQLQKLHQNIIDNNAREAQGLSTRKTEKPLKCIVRIKKAVERPPTPSLVSSQQSEAREPVVPSNLADGSTKNSTHEELEQAVILLQRVIRGRTTQALMFQGKERRKSLISELQARRRLTLATQSAVEDALLNKEEPNNSLVSPGVHIQLQTLGNALEAPLNGFNMACDVQSIHSASQLPSVLENPDILAERRYESLIQAEFVGQQLDFYTKEIVRLREQRRIAAMVKLAERTRRMREASESGLRQAEMNARAHQDAVFKQVMDVHQETVEMFLENVIAKSISTTSSIFAREQVREYASRINAVVDDLKEREHSGEDVNPALVSDLVSRFLIPEVKREILRAEVKQEQAKYSSAANGALTETKIVVSDMLENELANLTLNSST